MFRALQPALMQGETVPQGQRLQGPVQRVQV